MSEVLVERDDVEISFGARLTQLAERHPDTVSILFVGDDGSERVLTWIDLERWSNSVAWSLHERGIGLGSFVAIGLPRCPEHFAATFGAWKTGATVLPLSSTLPGWERDAVLGDIEAGAVIADWPDVAGVVSRADVAALAAVAVETFPSEVPNPPVAIGSGGSTGRPKVVLAPGNGARVPGKTLGPIGELVGLRTGLRTLVTSPLYHNLGFYITYLGVFDDNFTVVLERFDAQRVVDLVEQHQVQWMTLVPTMMQRIASFPDVTPAQLSSLEVVLHTAAPCPPWLKEAWIDLIGPEHLLEVYSSSEQVGFCVISGTEWLEHRGSVGRPVYSEVAILGSDGEHLPTGEVGEVFMRMLGSTEPAYRYAGGAMGNVADGGFASVGDLGWVDEQGYVHLADRRADLIISGGSNVYPAEVEAALGEHPAVADVVVIGLTDTEWGRRVHAVLEAHAGVERPADDALVEFARARLDHYKVPRSWEWVDTLPRNEAGKVRRSALISERGRARVAHGRRRRIAIAVGLATAVTLGAGCGVHGLTFVSDERVEITAPRDRATEALPFTLEWTARDIDPDHRFAVLVDRTPPASGKRLASLFRDRSECAGDEGQAACEDPAYLAEQGILVTDEHRVRIAAVEALRGEAAQRSFHTVTIIIVDGDGRRIGEGAWRRDVEIEP